MVKEIANFDNIFNDLEEEGWFWPSSFNGSCYGFWKKDHNTYYKTNLPFFLFYVIRLLFVNLSPSWFRFAHQSVALLMVQKYLAIIVQECSVPKCAGFCICFWKTTTIGNAEFKVTVPSKN